ncbi:metal-dependent hydrolase [Candidatus Woesearchaeota archaeon]|nr:metal-dependent hydrolase [Candidatus Woesearchaeota archaeon]
MANVATHILVPMLLAEIYRRNFAKKQFSRWYVLFAGFMGAIPDFDLLYTRFATGSFNMMYHRSLTHSLFIPALLLVAGIAIYFMYLQKIIKYDGWEVCCCLIFAGSFGLATHTMLDGIDGLKYWFYPLAWEINLPNLIYNKFRAGILDGVLLLVWLLYDKEILDDLLIFLHIRETERK